MSVLRTLLGADRPVRNTMPWSDYLNYFSYGGHSYPLGFSQTLTGAKQEIADGTFGSFTSLGYRGNGVIFACMLARLALFSEARFQFRRMEAGRPGDLFGTGQLSVLEKPWYGGTTGDLLARMITDADLAGNAYVARRGDRLRRLRPDWVGIAMGSVDDPEVDGWDVDADVLGHIYWPGGMHSGREPELFGRGEVAHFAPIPDPMHNYRGMSWVTPIVREMAADSAARDHKLSFFENGATPNMVVRLDKESKASQSPQAFTDWVDKFRGQTEARNSTGKAYRTMYLAGGADITVVGSDLKQLDFKTTQGAGETRIAAAAGVPPVIVGLSEGLQAATYSNYGQARRRFADLTMRPLWRNAAGSLAVIVPPPVGADLWYDDRDIPFLAEDRKDAAEIAGREAQTLRTLVDAGYLPESVIAAVQANDWSALKHSGLFSVQLQPPNPDGAKATDAGRALASLIAPHLPPAA